MLLAVEGGGFFYASASGYSKFLNLLLFGRRNEERPMRVLPWNQYQLVDQEIDPDIQLAPKKNQSACRCKFFICFDRPPASLDGTSPPKVEPLQSESLPDPSVSDKGRDSTTSDAREESGRKILLKSSLKKHSSECSVKISGDESILQKHRSERSAKVDGNENSGNCPSEGPISFDGNEDVHKPLDEVSDATAITGRRKVQWTDTCGRELAEIREFEASDEGSSDEESDCEGNKRCECVIQ